MKNNGIADFIKPTLITAQQYGTKVSVEIDHSDTDIDELFDAFRTIIIGLGYHDSAWKNWILDRADEYREEDEDDSNETETFEPNTPMWKHLSQTQIDEALAQHNLHGEGFEFDESDYYGIKKLKKKKK